MIDKGPAVSPAIAAGLICLIVGGAAGFYAKSFVNLDNDQHIASASRSGGAPGGPPGGMGGRGGGGGFGGGSQNSGGLALARLVTNINTIEEAQGKGLKPEQAKALLPILQKLKSAEKISAEEADKDSEAINKVLTDDQKTMLEAMQPRGGFGGGGGGGGFGGGGGRPTTGAYRNTPDASEAAKAAASKGTPVAAAGEAPGGPAGAAAAPGGGGGRRGGPVGMAGGPGGGGGGRPDPEKPFASERNQKGLDSLIAHVSK